ncbi:tumor necrosis factor receptor superfamily member 11B-like, partial [Mizuhopecten yessoensis]|uniref:tumor necrosis factor receptor superfamily member 11B-like n=1 Tax=Mizuhopecten yessoensis TaxID=6573 RepID=UPI000B4592D1
MIEQYHKSISRNVVVTIVIASFIIPVSQVAPFISSASQATCTELRPYITKGNLTCFECPPGFYLSGDCTSNNTIAVCEVCPQGYYSSVPGVHTSCAICSSFCESDNLEVVSNCSSTTNLTCDCPPGKVLKDPHDKQHAICEDPPTPKTTQNCLDETTKKGNASTHNQTKADPDS